VQHLVTMGVFGGFLVSTSKGIRLCYKSLKMNKNTQNQWKRILAIQNP